MARASSSSLKTYREKRDFERTPEPDDKAAAKGQPKDGFFMVQKHDASRLHYDFRLAVDGVLKSWAVTKGPSFNPADKRLAVRTEDHPLSYATFEGVIPKELYGGGTVMLWDRGPYEAEGDLSEAIEKGSVKLRLKGERMKGGFALVRMKPKKGEKRENWLLIKERDEEADEDLDIARFDTSVASGRKMEAIAQGAPARKKGRAASGKGKGRSAGNKGRPSAGLPGFQKPQLATLVDDTPRGDGWLYELKYDGYRLLSACDGSDVRCYTRNGKDWTEKFEPLAEGLRKLSLNGALLDGEAVVADEAGRTDFGALQRALKEEPEAITYFVFDLLALDGEDWRGRPQAERKERLEKLLEWAEPPVYYSDHVEGDGSKVAAQACQRNLEGIIAKRADATYVSRRSKSWLKIKCVKRQEFVVGGWSPSDRKRPFSSLLVGVNEGGKLVYAGRVGSGFDEATLIELSEAMRGLKRKTSPFADVPRSQAKDAHWVAPELVVELRYAEITRDGQLRHAVFEGLRHDKPASDVKWERPMKKDSAERESQTKKASPAGTDSKGSSAKSGKKAGGRKADGEKKDGAITVAGVRITHPDRVLFDTMGVTKSDLAAYYDAVADLMLPHIEGRPISLVRCPEGRSGECFFQKHANAALPDAIGRVAIAEKSGGKKDYLLVDSRKAVVGCAQVGALELHVWAARKDRIERPDRMVFDLDPDPSVSFEEVKQAAHELKEILGEAGLTSFPLLTGGKGVHLVLPFERRYSWDSFAGFAKAFAGKIASLDSGRFVATMSKQKRKGRIFIDHLRNQRGSTAIAPFSPRAREGAPVAVPVDWKELKKFEAANVFSLADVKALRGRAKAWKDYGKTGNRLSAKVAATLGLDAWKPD